MLEHVLTTWRALIAPRRLIPILVVLVPLVVAQGIFTLWNAPAVFTGALMGISTILLAPASYRYLFPLGQRPPHLLARAVVYFVLGTAAVWGTGILIPEVFDLGVTFLTADPSLAVCATLFWVGGWGLARDIDMERNLEAERARADLANKQREQAQLMAVRAHLDPHFLFNTLNALAEWTREDPETAEAGILRLAAMLRTMLAGTQASTWSLHEELELVDALFALHTLRDPERFQVEWTGRALADGVQVPPMVLLPLAENAMTHGPAKGHRGVVRATLRRDGDLVFELENPGAFTGPRPGGHGIDMVRQRLALAYGPHADLQLRAGDGRTLATVRLGLDQPEGL